MLVCYVNIEECKYLSVRWLTNIATHSQSYHAILLQCSIRFQQISQEMSVIRQTDARCLKILFRHSPNRRKRTSPQAAKFGISASTQNYFSSIGFYRMYWKGLTTVSWFHSDVSKTWLEFLPLCIAAHPLLDSALPSEEDEIVLCRIIASATNATADNQQLQTC